MKGLMDDIGRALEGIYDPSKPLPRVNGTDAGDGAGPSQRLEEMDPFAKVTGVAPGSPAAEAVSTRGSGTRLDDTRHILQGLQREDLVVRFGALMGGSVAGGLGAVAAYVSEHEEVSGWLVRELADWTGSGSKRFLLWFDEGRGKWLCR
ncbi:hypothetical protein SISNIDRAFT_188507 [Sistotremastrum niveocremeum HHB9708]|uniref:Uncharacterized protein n=1 Tax=Sistotremastrum niveocremeum HHB9708 TaxID=1314777 RepID=A0A164Z461_9AGAM|nr:hypothetical protein SISNIDRAFT_188507 [Sistotremastrum niveocremeum HHB9708]